METIDILIDRILPNPRQPREREDPGHVMKIALSIAHDGLMQAPVGRWVFPDGTPAVGMGRADLTTSGMKVQLAFGHSRLAAFKWLETVKDHSDLKGDWSHMPVVVKDLTDDQMLEELIHENIARKNWTPIEEARLMLDCRERGKTSLEIGELFGLSDSAVRNKIRLLSLPETLQDALRRGDITEGVGRALVPLYDLPEAARLQAEDSDDIKPSEILEAARSGLAPARIAEMVTALARRINPGTEQLAIPLATPADPGLKSGAMASVSVETVEPGEEIADDGETADYDPAGEMTAEPEEPVQRTIVEHIAGTDTNVVTRPAPAPIPPAPRPAPQPEQTPAPKPAAAQPVAKPEPKPAPEPAAPVTWEASTILLSLTLWPEDSHGHRMVSIGGRVNQGSPLMAMASLGDMDLPYQLADMLEKLRNLGNGEAK